MGGDAFFLSMLVLGEAHLRRMLKARARYYNEMLRSLAPFSGPESLGHTRSLADFITTMSDLGFRYTQLARSIS